MEKRSADDQCLIWDIRDKLRPRKVPRDPLTAESCSLSHGATEAVVAAAKPAPCERHPCVGTLKWVLRSKSKGLPHPLKTQPQAHFTLAATIMRTFHLPPPAAKLDLLAPLCGAGMDLLYSRSYVNPAMTPSILWVLLLHHLMAQPPL